MFTRYASTRPRPGMSRVEVVLSVLLLILTGGLLIPACARVGDGGTRTQAICNLKNIGLAIHGFHDANKRLPFNGTINAIPGDAKSGSWAFQVLPHIDQGPLFNKPNVVSGVPSYMCPSRGRPPVEQNLGAWTDYFLNNYLNDPKNAATPNNADTNVTLDGIKDGTSNTVLVGQGNIATGHYAKTTGVTGSTNIFVGGGFGTARAGLNWLPGTTPTVLVQRDSSLAPNLAGGGWGGPFPQGAMIAMGDATVRMFPYSTNNFGAFLTPTGDEKVELPDT